LTVNGNEVKQSIPWQLRKGYYLQIPRDAEFFSLHAFPANISVSYWFRSKAIYTLPFVPSKSYKILNALYFLLVLLSTALPAKPGPPR
jgi:hypothetical protein